MDVMPLPVCTSPREKQGVKGATEGPCVSQALESGGQAVESNDMSVLKAPQPGGAEHGRKSAPEVPNQGSGECWTPGVMQACLHSWEVEQSLSWS